MPLYGLTPEEREEFEDLKKQLFGKDMFVILDEGQDHSKVQRYNYLMKKKQECYLASNN